MEVARTVIKRRKVGSLKPENTVLFKDGYRTVLSVGRVFGKIEIIYQTADGLRKVKYSRNSSVRVSTES